jgi:hypothetical protein
MLPAAEATLTVVPTKFHVSCALELFSASRRGWLLLSKDREAVGPFFQRKRYIFKFNHGVAPFKWRDVPRFFHSRKTLSRRRMIVPRNPNNGQVDLQSAGRATIAAGDICWGDKARYPPPPVCNNVARTDLGARVSRWALRILIS